MSILKYTPLYLWTQNRVYFPRIFEAYNHSRFSLALKRDCCSISHVIPANKYDCEMLNNSQNSRLLAAQTTLQIPRRTTMDKSNQISLETPVADYKRLIENMLKGNLSDDEQTETYKAIACETRNLVWKLLFDDPQPPSEERLNKAAELLKEHKLDACFFVPWDYNDWIVDFRDELLKRKLLDFWHKIIVKEQLGLCCARDSDYFDDMDDPEPANFYRHAGAVPAWETKTNTETPNSIAAENFASNIPAASAVTSTASVSTSTDYNISVENPLDDYKKLIRTNLTENTTSNDYQVEVVYSSIAENARKTAWSLLFDDPQPPSAERQQKAGDLLKEHKTDASFYAPWVYNDWVLKLKDEVLKRELLDFWRNHVVKRELGLCWARDSDYFDDMDDPEPAKFYKHAGCTAPWLNEEDQNRQNEQRSGDGQ